MWPGHGAAFPWWCLTWVSRLPQAGLAQELLCLSMAMALASKVLSLITFAWNSKNLHLASYLFQCLWIQLLGSPDILEKPYCLLFVTFLTFLCCDLRISSSCFWGGRDRGRLIEQLALEAQSGLTQTGGNPRLYKQQHQTVQEIYLKSVIATNTWPAFLPEDGKTVVESAHQRNRNSKWMRQGKEGAWPRKQKQPPCSIEAAAMFTISREKDKGNATWERRKD